MTAIRTNGIGKASAFHLNLTNSIADDPAFFKRPQPPRVYKRKAKAFYNTRNQKIIAMADTGISVDVLALLYKTSETRIIEIIKGRRK